jgi:hypothetical protein
MHSPSPRLASATASPFWGRSLPISQSSDCPDASFALGSEQGVLFKTVGPIHPAADLELTRLLAGEAADARVQIERARQTDRRLRIDAGGAQQRNPRSALRGEPVPAKAARGMPEIPATDARKKIAAHRSPQARILSCSFWRSISQFNAARTLCAKR